MSNEYLNVQIESEFQYTSASFKEGQSEERLTELLQQELLDYQLYFEQSAWLDSEIEHIANELVETGKVFARNQGFGEGLTISTRNSGRRMISGTGNLVNSIKAEPISRNGIKTINFYNDAQNERGQYYAGHMEYGFHDRGGNFVPARPFMRPALYAVSEGSKANLTNIMRGLLGNLWTGRGFQGVSTLSFGQKSQHPYSRFWSSSKNFSKGLSRKSGMKSLKENKHRKLMSTMRPGNKHSVKKAKGYKLAQNRREFSRLRQPRGIRQKTSSSKTKGSSNKTPRQQNRNYSFRQRGVYKYDNRYRQDVAKDGSIHSSRQAAIVHQKGSSQGIERQYIEKVSYGINRGSYSGIFKYRRTR